jgi:hypothetical protein
MSEFVEDINIFTKLKCLLQVGYDRKIRVIGKKSEGQEPC